MKTKTIQPYLFFGGACEDALEFYKSAIGAEVDELIRFNESPEPHPEGMLPDGWGDKIMHTSFKVGEALVMASDGCGEAGNFEGFSLSIALTDKDEAESLFSRLSQGGKVTMPLSQTFWSPCFGMLEDKFGVGWMINVCQSSN